MMDPWLTCLAAPSTETFRSQLCKGNIFITLLEINLRCFHLCLPHFSCFSSLSNFWRSWTPSSSRGAGVVLVWKWITCWGLLQRLDSWSFDFSSSDRSYFKQRQFKITLDYEQFMTIYAVTNCIMIFPLQDSIQPCLGRHAKRVGIHIDAAIWTISTYTVQFSTVPPY